MSATVPIIADWIRLGLKWNVVKETKIASYTLQPGEMRQLPRDDYTFTYPEGVILHFSAAFNHPACGIRFEAEPGLDLEDDFTVANFLLGGATRPEALIYAVAPPETAPGLYGLRLVSPWVFQETLRIWVFNSDTVEHKTYGHGYHIAVLNEPRPNHPKEKD